MLADVLVLSLGSAVAKAALRIWLGPDSVQASASQDVVDGLRGRLASVVERRRLTNQIDRAAEAVATKLTPFVEVEFRSIEQSEKVSIIESVADAIGSTDLSIENFVAADLDPARVEDCVRNAPNFSARRVGLSSAGEALFDFLLQESCNYIVEIVITLPRFTNFALRELLQRESGLIDLVSTVLERLPRSTLNQDHEDARFEEAYLRQVVRRLDRLELFGVDVSELSRRYALSVAYITLSAGTAAAGRIRKEGMGTGGPSWNARNGGEEDLYVKVDDALSEEARVLIRGEAGSGKTTLLQWLAVNSARRAFASPLENWNDTVPLFIQLRHYVNTDLPQPENFLKQLAPHLAGGMPHGWVHRQLEQKRALLLIDGLDELPDHKRHVVRSWIDDLAAAFEGNRIVLTSRPPAVEAAWLEGMDLVDLELQPMGVADIDAFIEHWYRAVGGDSPAGDDAGEIERQEDALKRAIKSNRRLRALATSPLLCAMLCALNRDRRTHLPRDRMELYRIALESLLERRDVERDVRIDLSTPLSLREKIALLEDLAWWLMRNDQSDIAMEQAVEVIDRKLSAMPNVSIPADRVFKYLLVRSGVLREPVTGRIDFIHRTFQEYLAAHALVEADDVPMLIDRARHDQWREVVVLAAGHARVSQREKLISGLLEKGDAIPSYRHVLHLLAVACLETSSELSPSLVNEIRARLARLLPPQNMSEAKALASAGELAVSLLRNDRRHLVQPAAASVRALALIGGEEALEALRSYSNDSRVTVFRELVRAWSSFEIDEFAKRVLCDSPLEHGRLVLSDSRLMAAVAHLKRLEDLYLDLSERRAPLAVLPNLELLSGLDLSYNRVVRDLTPIAHAHNLRDLKLVGSQVADLSPLAGLRKLEYLDLSFCANIDNLDSLEHLTSLRWLRLLRCEQLSSFAPLSGCEKLSYLDCEGCRGLYSLEALAELPISELDLRACWHVASFTIIQSFDKLRRFYLSENDHTDTLDFLGGRNLEVASILDCGLLRNIDALRGMPLRTLSIGGSLQLQNLSAISELRNLTTLSVTDCPSVTELPKLSDLRFLRNVTVVGLAPGADLSGLEGLSGRVITLDEDGAAHVSEAFKKRNFVRVRPAPRGRVAAITGQG